MPTLPPIQQDAWEAHKETQFAERTRGEDTAIASLGALEQEDAQRAQAREQAFQQRTAQEDASIASLAQAEQQPERDFAARTAREDAAIAAYAQQEQQGYGSPPRAEGLATADADTRAGTSRIHSPAVEAHRAAVEAAFGDQGPQVVENMLGIMDRESGGNPGAVKSDAIEDSHGPFQINARAHPDLAARYDLHDPQQNARAAREVYDRQGYGAWLNASRQLGLLDDNGRPTTQEARGGTANEGMAADSVSAPPPMPADESTRIQRARAPSRVEAVGQFEQGLPYAEAASICGPVAALAFVQANGRNPSLAEVRALAKRRGWTPEGGMNGVANEQALLSDLGVKSRLDTDPDFGEIAADAGSGNPVIISTPRHYWYANDYDPTTGKVFVGKTGTSRTGGGSWMTPQQIAELDGGINGVLYVDNPGSPRPSVAAADTGGDRPPSEFEPPSRYTGEGASVGGSFDRGADPLARYREQPAAPVPDFPIPAVVGRGVRAIGELAGLTNRVGEPEAEVARDRIAARTGLAADEVERLYNVGSVALGAEGPRVGQHVPDPGDFAAYMQYRKDLAAGRPTGSVRRSLIGTRAEEAYYRETNPGLARDVASADEAAQAMDRWDALDAAGVGANDPRRRALLARFPELGPPVDELGAAPRAPGAAAPELGPGAAQETYLGPTDLARAPTPPGAPPPGGGGGRQPSLLPPDAGAAVSAPAASPTFARFWNRTRNVIESQGETGKQLGGMLRAWRERAETLAGGWTADLPTVRKLPDADFRQFVAAAEGKIEPRSPLVQRAVAEWDAVRTDVYERARKAGLDIGRLENYFPHVFEPDAFRGKGWADAVTHLVRSGQADSRAEASVMLRAASDWARNRRYGNLETERALDLPFYKRTKDVLFGQGGYLEGAANRIAQVEQFGPKDARALELIDRIDQETGNGRVVSDLYDVAVGQRRYDPGLQAVSGALRGANTVMSLGLSAITNAGQFANTAAVVGLGPTARNAWRALRSPEAKEAAIRAGVTLDNVVADVREGTGLASRALGRITAPGFGSVERFNRTLAFHAGVSYAEDMAAAAARGDRTARTALERLGLDAGAVAERGVLSEAEKVTAGRRIVERTQFKVDPQDLPQWASHPAGKVFAQFKTFSYNQSAFLGREIVQPALRGDLRPLARFMVAGLAAGAVTTETRNAIQRREPERDPVKRILQYYQAAGGLGLAGDVLRVTSPVLNINADRLDPDRVVTQAVGTVLGPTVGTGIEALSGVAQATRGNVTPGLRSLLRRIPVVGTTAQNIAVPYKPRGEAPPPPAPSRNRDSGRDTRERSRSRSR